MLTPRRRLLAPLTLAAIALSTPVGAQHARPSHAFPAAPRPGRSQLPAVAGSAACPDSAAPRGPTLPVMIFRSSAVALASGGAGSLVGMVVDDQRCKHHAARDPGWRAGSLFGPCFFETGVGTAVGFVGGSLTGAAVVASRDARRRGCPAREARLRAIVGATLGALPGAIAAATIGGDDDIPPGRSAVIFSAPLVSGAGAAYLASRCARRPPTVPRSP